MLKLDTHSRRTGRFGSLASASHIVARSCRGDAGLVRSALPSMAVCRMLPDCTPWVTHFRLRRRKTTRALAQDSGMTQFRARLFTAPVSCYQEIPGQIAAGESGFEVSGER